MLWREAWKKEQMSSTVAVPFSVGASRKAFSVSLAKLTMSSTARGMIPRSSQHGR
jgi:hypothetical protein